MDNNKQQDQTPQKPQARDTSAPQTPPSNPPAKENGKEDDPVERGRQAVEARKATSGVSPEQHEENEKKDAEQWRNEG